MEKASATMAFTASLHTEVSPPFSLVKLRPASQKPKIITYLSLLPRNTPSRIIPTNDCSNAPGSTAQARRHNTANTPFVLHDWDAELAQVDTKKKPEILYRPSPADF